MPRLECSKCKAIFQDVLIVRKCVLCGNRSFKNIEPLIEVKIFPKWFTYSGNIGFLYLKTIRSDPAAEL